jgi:hypothetical protein
MATDPDVVSAAYAEASKKTSNATILLALFEAGIVESGFKNDLTATDHDSLGYLQQRPSQGWKDPTNVATATDSFIAKAEKILAGNPSITAGDLAQAVQVSAYPDRYAQQSSAAQKLLSQASSGKVTGTGSDAATGALLGAGGVLAIDPLTAIADAIKSGFAPLAEVGKVSDFLFKASMPSNIIRMLSGIAGAFFIIVAIALLAREMRK